MNRCDYCGTDLDLADELGQAYGHRAEHCREYLKAAIGSYQHENGRLAAGLRLILAGKVARDDEHPLGAGWGMAGRFIEIAKSTLTKGSANGR